MWDGELDPFVVLLMFSASSVLNESIQGFWSPDTSTFVFLGSFSIKVTFVFSQSEGSCVGVAVADLLRGSIQLVLYPQAWSINLQNKNM